MFDCHFDTEHHLSMEIHVFLECILFIERASLFLLVQYTRHQFPLSTLNISLSEPPVSNQLPGRHEAALEEIRSIPGLNCAVFGVKSPIKTYKSIIKVIHIVGGSRSESSNSIALSLLGSSHLEAVAYQTSRNLRCETSSRRLYIGGPQMYKHAS